MAPIGFAISRRDYAPREEIELPMRKRERFSLLSQEGEFWFIAQNVHGKEGYIPAVHVVVEGEKPSELLYKRWRGSCDALIQRGSITIHDWNELAVPKEASWCTKFACRAWKDLKSPHGDRQASLGVCVHEMEHFLRADPSYSSAWLKAERLRWHPDRFTARCSPAARPDLASRAGDMFTTLTKLYEIELARAPDEAEPPHKPSQRAPEEDAATEPEPVPSHTSSPSSSTMPSSSPSNSTVPHPGPSTISPTPSAQLDPTAQIVEGTAKRFENDRILSAVHDCVIVPSSSSPCSVPIDFEDVEPLAKEAARRASRVPPSESKGSAVACRSKSTQSHLQRPSKTSSTIEEPASCPPRDLNPSAPVFKPRKMPAIWSNSMEHDIAHTHGQQSEVDTEATIEIVTEPSTRSTAVTSTDNVFAAEGSTSHAPETDSERHQRLLEKARALKAKALEAIKQDLKTNPGDESTSRHETRQKTRREAERQAYMRDKWCKPPSVEDRAAQQAKRKAKMEKMRATAEARLNARAQQRSGPMNDWQEASTANVVDADGRDLASHRLGRSSPTGSDATERGSRSPHHGSRGQGEVDWFWGDGRRPSSGPPSVAD